ncbi:MAG: hypothetical protein CSA81_09375 [Acidobacteria bacterium]|nr:MAG: hypothetical protein CSA81_09375 [Acidobacteriota bacterium]
MNLTLEGSMHFKLISSASNPEVKAVKKLNKRDSSLFTVEGEKLISVAVASGYVMESCWSTEKSQQLTLPEGTALRQVTKNLYRSLSPTKSSNGPLCVFQKKRIKGNFNKHSGRYLLLDSIQDPGNAGTMIRAAKAFGLDGILWYGSKLNIYKHALIRASAGASMTMNHYELNLTLVGDCGQLEWIAATANEGTPLDRFKWPNSYVLCMGNEGHGLSHEINQLCHKRLTVPMNRHVESLNVAGATHIILYDARHKSQ